jgi:hypothetical protein
VDGESSRKSVVRTSTVPPLAVLTLALFALFGASYGYFLQNEFSFNVVCRAGLSANLVQHGRVDINDVERITDDKAVRDGVYYCDKAPGMSFLAVPAAWAFTSIFPITRETPEEDGNTWPLFLYLSTLTTSAFWCAFAAVVLFGYLRERTGDVRAALVGAVAFGLATPVWGWATSFFSHAAAGAFLLMGFITLDSAARRIGAGKPNLWLAIAGGAALSISVSVEYTALFPAAIIGAVVGLSHLKRETLTPLVRMFAIAFAAAVVAIIPTLMYHAAAFGSPFTTGYRFAAHYEGTRTGLFGVGVPDLGVMAELVFGPRRGLFWYAPIVAPTLFAAWLAWKRSDVRPALIVSGLVLLVILIINAGFAYWMGGASTGPRYLTPALAFAGLALGLSWPSLAMWGRRVTLAVLALSVFINLAAVAVDMTVSEELGNPIFDRVLPQFFSGVLHMTMAYKALKLDGLITLVPLLLIWAGLGWLIWRNLKRVEADKAASA